MCFISNVYNAENMDIPEKDKPFFNNIYDNLFMLHAQNIIDWRIVKAMCYAESRYNPLVQNISSGAKGLMQITEDCCNDIGFCYWNNLLNADHNVKVGCAYIQKIKFYYSKSFDIKNNIDMLIVYNGGFDDLLRYKKDGALPDDIKFYISEVKKFYSYLGGVL